MVKVRLGLTTRVRIIRKHTTDSAYGSKQNIINYRPPQSSNAHSTLHIDTIIVCRSNARGKIPTPYIIGDIYGLANGEAILRVANNNNILRADNRAAE